MLIAGCHGLDTATIVNGINHYAPDLAITIVLRSGVSPMSGFANSLQVDRKS
jgi:hypothetical protein